MCRLDEIKKQKDNIYAVAGRYNAYKVYVFGSCARKEETSESDIDLIIDCQDKSFSLFDWVKLESELSTILGTKVDLVPMSSLDDSNFSKNARKDMVLL